jgi:hypothetical protein
VQSLKAYLAEAKGVERWETRFTLAGTLLGMNRQPEAKQVLAAFEAQAASSVHCATAALLAQTMKMGAQRNAWIAMALAKPSSFHDRMELGSILMSRLSEVEKAEALFDQALKSAADDEGKAAVIWHLASANREREDIPEGTYDAILGRLAEEYPKTRYGRIAGDRLRAMNFKLGHDAIGFAQQTLDGKTFELAKHKGSVVMLGFLAAEIESSAAAARALQDLHQQFKGAGNDQGKGGLRVLGIWLDPKRKAAVDAVKRLGLSFPQTWCEGGWQSDLALRYRIEDAPQCLLIGRDGKLAGMNFVLNDEQGLREVIQAVERALR